MKIFCISLKDKPELRNNMEYIKNYFGDEFRFFDGIRVSQFQFKNLILTNQISPFYTGGRKTFSDLLGESGAWLAHRKLWKYIIDNNIEKTLILEDSIIFDIKNYEQIKEQFNNHENDILFIGGFCLNAYIITCKSAMKLLELTNCITYPLDLMIADFCRYNTLSYYKFVDCVKKDRSKIHSTSDILIDQFIDFSSKQDFRTLIERYIVFPKLENQKKKIAFCATHPYMPTGYAKVGYEFTKRLSDYFDVLYLGFQYSGIKLVNDREIGYNMRLYDLAKLSPNSFLNFGFPAIQQILEDENPDYLMIYNDYDTILTMLETIPDYKGKIICYLDLVCNNQSYEKIELIKKYAYKTFVFTEYFKNHLIKDYGFQKDTVGVINHGMRDMVLFPNPRQTLNIDIDDFIVLNINRNSERKRLETTIHAFIEFWKYTNWDCRVKLQISCPLYSPNGLDILDYVKVLTKEYNKSFEELTFNILNTTAPEELPDEIIDRYLQSADVILTTSAGEGWGLLVFESAYYGKYIIATDLEVHKEILKGYENVEFIEKTGELYNRLGTYPTYNYLHFADKLYLYYINWKNGISKKYDGSWLKDKYEWSKIVDKFVKEIDN